MPAKRGGMAADSQRALRLSHQPAVSLHALQNGLLKDRLIPAMDEGEPLGGSSDPGLK